MKGYTTDVSAGSPLGGVLLGEGLDVGDGLLNRCYYKLLAICRLMSLWTR